jgi:hypothetical protein
MGFVWHISDNVGFQSYQYLMNQVFHLILILHAPPDTCVPLMPESPLVAHYEKI